MTVPAISSALYASQYATRFNVGICSQSGATSRNRDEALRHLAHLLGTDLVEGHLRCVDSRRDGVDANRDTLQRVLGVEHLREVRGGGFGAVVAEL